MPVEDVDCLYIIGEGLVLSQGYLRPAHSLMWPSLVPHRMLMSPVLHGTLAGSHKPTGKLPYHAEGRLPPLLLWKLWFVNYSQYTGWEYRFLSKQLQPNWVSFTSPPHPPRRARFDWLQGSYPKSIRRKILQCLTRLLVRGLLQASMVFMHGATKLIPNHPFSPKNQSS